MTCCKFDFILFFRTKSIDLRVTSERSDQRLQPRAEEGLEDQPQGSHSGRTSLPKTDNYSLIKFLIPVLYAGAYRQFIMTDSLPLNETF